MEGTKKSEKLFEASCEVGLKDGPEAGGWGRSGGTRVGRGRDL